MNVEKDEEGLVDLVDVVLEEGVILDADLVITVGGTPLIGLKLRAALGGMFALCNHGVMDDLDEEIRLSND